MKWIAGCNHPGYLPDNEPREFATWGNARQAIIDEIEETLGNLYQFEDLAADSGDQVNALQENLEDHLELLCTEALAGQEYSATIGSWCYWIAKKGVEDWT